MDKEAALEDLAATAAAGDIDAFEHLVRRSHGFLMSRILLTGVTEADRDDVAQEACMRMYRRLETWDRSRPFLPWYRTLIRHVAIDHLRRAGRQLDRRRALRAQLIHEEQVDQMSPLDRLLATPCEAVQRCLDRLSEHHRRLLRLRYLDDRTPAEIATVEAAKPGAIRTALSRIRGTLKNCIEGAQNNEVDHAISG